MTHDQTAASPGGAPAQGPAFSVWTDFRPEPGEPDGRRRYAEVLDEVRLVDELGYHAFCTTEQHGVADGYLPAQLTAIAGLGTVTSRVRFTTNTLLVLLHPWRNVVEQAIVADLLTEGRVSLGMGVGNYQREFDLFGVDMRRRAELMEQAIPFVRKGLVEGVLPDGPGGADVPVLPRPAQPRIPIYLGGNAKVVMDRAARLADGAMPVDFFDPDEEFPRLWETKLRPAMERHGRTREDFRFTICAPMWATDDPERDWATFFRPALEYQFGKYAEWAGDPSRVGVESSSAAPWDDGGMLFDTPENLAARLLRIRARAPYDELVFWYRIPHLGHERAMAHLELMAKRVMPLVQAGATAAAQG